jgi:hypothetical protein
VRDGSHLLGLTLDGKNNPAADPVGFENCEKIQSVVIPVSPQAKTAGPDFLVLSGFLGPGHLLRKFRDDDIWTSRLGPDWSHRTLLVQPNPPALPPAALD